LSGTRIAVYVDGREPAAVIHKACMRILVYRLIRRAHILPPLPFSWSLFRKPDALDDAGLQVGRALIPACA
jgi:hypothetical protein